MANRPKTSSRDWVEAGYEMLASSGLDGIRVDHVVSELGASKSGFYHRFADRDEFLGEVTRRWVDHGTEVFNRALAEPDPVARLRAVVTLALTDRRLRQADSWLLLYGSSDPLVDDVVNGVHEQSRSWAREQLIELGFDDAEASMRGRLYYVGYLGLLADLRVRDHDPDEAALHDVVDRLVGLIVRP